MEGRMNTHLIVDVVFLLLIIAAYTRLARQTRRADRAEGQAAIARKSLDNLLGEITSLTIKLGRAEDELRAVRETDPM